MDLAKKLKQARQDSGFSQEQVARQLNVAREVVSQWESETRTPSVKHLEQLANFYGAGYLIKADASADTTRADERDVLVSGLYCDDESLNKEVSNWLDFLDRWATYKKTTPGFSPGRGKPPKALDRGIAFKDGRYAAREAQHAREHFNVGRDAIPNLYTLLDEWDFLVYKANLGRWVKGSKEGISGSFYNHPDLGYCIVVNAQTTPGRQTFTLAHELAHALYHYSLRTIVSRAGNRNQIESFADAFAEYFLVPTKVLNSIIDDYGWKGALDPFKAIYLTNCFQVSWLFMLYRLHSESLINMDQLREWSGLSPKKLAEAIGVESALFVSDVQGVQTDLQRFPPSVLSEVRDALVSKRIERNQAADLLGIDDADKLYKDLFELVPADDEEKAASAEYELQLAGGRR